MVLAKLVVWVMGCFVMGLTLLGDFKMTWSLSACHVLAYYGLTNLAALRLPQEARRFPVWIAWVGLISCFGLALCVERYMIFVGLGLLGLGWIVRVLVTRFSVRSE